MKQRKLYMNILSNMQKEKFRFTFEKIRNKEVKDDLTYNNYKFYFGKRKKIIQILIHLNCKLCFNEESLFLAIHFIDIIANLSCSDPFINFEKVNFKKMAIACTLLSSKFTENDPNIPNVKDYEIDKNHHYYGQSESVNELKKLEVEYLILLDHKLNYSTPYDFLKMFSTISFFFKEDFENFKLFKNLNSNPFDVIDNINDDSFRKNISESYYKCQHLLLKFIQENQIFSVKNEFDSFRFVCAIIYFARELFYSKLTSENNKISKKLSLWPQKMITIYNIKFDEFKEEYYLLKKYNYCLFRLFEIQEKTSPSDCKTERKIQIQPDFYNNPDSYKNKNNSRPLSTSNSRLNNYLNLQNQEIYKDNVVTMPNNFEESGSPSLFKFGNKRTNKNSELNLHLNYIGNTYTDINNDNYPINKKLNTQQIINKITDLNSNNSSSNNFYDAERKIVKSSFIDFNSDLRNSHSSLRENSETNIPFKIKNQHYNNDKILKDTSRNEIKKINFENFSYFKKNSYTIMDKNKINDPVNSNNKNNFEKFVNNELNLDSLNMKDLKKLINSKREIEDFSNRITNENHNNKEEIKSLLKEIYEKKDKSSENKLSRNGLNKDTDTFYTKLSDYKSKIFSERTGSRNPDEQYGLKSKINPNTNRFYAVNNTYENNLISFNESHNHNFSKIEYNNLQNNKNILDKTKRLLNKNSFDYDYDPNGKDIKEKHNFRKVSDDDYNNFYRNKDSDTKNSMIIIKNNVNINAYIDNPDKHNNFLEKKYINDYNIHDNKYSSYRNDNSNLEFLLNHKKNNVIKKLELDYNYNIYSKDLKKVENKKEYKRNFEILETEKRKNKYKNNHINYDIVNEDKYSHIKNQMRNYPYHYNRNLDFLKENIPGKYNNSNYDVYSLNPIREKYMNKN